ncbi:MAG TPA: DnaA regulatory inactivator Hda [Steroidobacteraceae bacterium]|jgi:DnaA family protein|nr:DnaA regulatory inactivator Hda [Steroidobacteraceae bacterium]
MRQLPLAMRLRERADFDSFVAGANETAVEQLRACARGAAAGVAAGGRAGMYWLCGPPGSGKSHLLQATCTLTASTGATALYLPLSQLLELGALALEEWEPAAVVALDELQVVAGRREWEQALFALYRAVEERGAALIAAAPAPPALLPFSLPDLASRFGAAMLLALRPLDESAQRRALQLRARARGLELPDDAALYLQRRFRRDLPTLCGLLDAIDSAALQAQRRLTVPFIRAALGPPSRDAQ